MPAVLVAALVVVPVVELFVLIQVGQVVGALPTIVLVVAVSVLGAALLRREGARTWRAFRAATLRGALPAREVADGVLVMAAGALLLTPGFVSDAVGLLLLLPPVRALLRPRLTAYATRRLVGVAPRPGRRPGGGGPGPRTVEGEVVDEQ